LNEPPAKRSWARVLVELAVIVVGVLVALAVDEWRSGVGDAELAETYRALLLSEVTDDSVNLAVAALRIDAKIEGLREIRRIRSGTPPDAGLADISRMIRITRFRGLPSPTTTALRDLESTGNLRLLPPALRARALRYYGRSEISSGLILQSFGQWPTRATQLVPGDAAIRTRASPGHPQNVSDEEYAEIVRRIRTARDLEVAIDLELGYAALQLSLLENAWAPLNEMLAHLRDR